jgi:RNA-binding protein NOB1
MRAPKLSSVKVVSEFSKKTGDFSVLSHTDIELLALAYELECEKNGGDWRLRKTPGQKRTNGPSPFKSPETASVKDQAAQGKPTEDSPLEVVESSRTKAEETATTIHPQNLEARDPVSNELEAKAISDAENPSQNPGSEGQKDVSQAPPSAEEDSPLEISVQQLNLEPASPEADEQGDDSDGWITPSNINRKQLEDVSSNSTKAVEPKTMQVVRFPIGS